ncbi:hypothetical protein M5K25_015571 [Dendrobium thyrsiflorum]|uniref:Uncharacterized protein n=1 Tax=Dendrobium thyrsiflorum TaxID=117978 RepID=A0ABD0UXI5_DENTH
MSSLVVMVDSVVGRPFGSGQVEPSSSIALDLVQPRVYSLTQQNAHDAPYVVIGASFIFAQPCCIAVVQQNVGPQVVVWKNAEPQVVVRQNIGSQVVVRQNVGPQVVVRPNVGLQVVIRQNVGPQVVVQWWSAVAEVVAGGGRRWLAVTGGGGGRWWWSAVAGGDGRRWLSAVAGGGGQRWRAGGGGRQAEVADKGSPLPRFPRTSPASRLPPPPSRAKPIGIGQIPPLVPYSLLPASQCPKSLINSSTSAASNALSSPPPYLRHCLDRAPLSLITRSPQATVSNSLDSSNV